MAFNPNLIVTWDCIFYFCHNRTFFLKRSGGSYPDWFILVIVVYEYLSPESSGHLAGNSKIILMLSILIKPHSSDIHEIK